MREITYTNCYDHKRTITVAQEGKARHVVTVTVAGEPMETVHRAGFLAEKHIDATVANWQAQGFRFVDQKDHP